MSAKHLLILLAVPALLGVPRQADARVAGKVFVSEAPLKDVSYKALVKHFARKKPSVELTRTKEKTWKGTMVAFFRKKAYAGPITIWIYDKEDKASIKAQEPTSARSVDQKGTGRHFVYDLVLDENVGFNKNRTYLLWVGQIVGGKNRVYARGQVTLKVADKAPAPPAK